VIQKSVSLKHGALPAGGCVEWASRYRGTSLIRNSTPPGPYSRTMPRVLWWPKGGGGGVLMSEVCLYGW